MDTTFKAGDRVKCTGMDQDYYGKLNIGQVYTVLSVRLGGWITVTENSGNWSYEDRYFELVPAKEPKRPLQVGDRVRVYGYDDGGGLWDGEKAVVTCAADDFNAVTVKDLSRTPSGYTVDVHAKQCRRLRSKK